LVSPEEADRRHRLGPTLLLSVLTVIAFALRIWRLGNWGFDSDETFTLRDSLNPRLDNPRPLLYFLNHYLVQPLIPLDEFGLRVLPALFGVLAIPAFYFVGRRLVGTRAALFGSLLLTFSGIHVYYSQFARYWTLVFLLTAIYPYAIYLGLRDRNRRMLSLGLLTAVIATLAHPVSVLLLGGMGVWVLMTYLRRDQLTHLWSQRGVRWGALAVVLLAVVIAVRFIPMLQGWVESHEAQPGSGEFLLQTPGGRGIKQIAYLLSYAEGLTLPLVLAGVLGIAVLWQRERSLALLLACMFTFPVLFLVLLSFRAPVSIFYLVPTTPIVFLGAGIFLDRMSELDGVLRPRWLLPAVLTAIILEAGAPTLISQYRDGRRYDFRAAANWLRKRMGPEDVLYSDQFKVMVHYLPGVRIEKLRSDPVPLAVTVREQHGSGRGAVWIVSPAPSHAFRTSRNIGKLKRWIYENCQLRNNLGVGRADFRQYYLQLYRCPPGVPPDIPETSE
jgi:4-amino-4-deoxy-L-arabinose transferase-like glycosyltransferase